MHDSASFAIVHNDVHNDNVELKSALVLFVMTSANRLRISMSYASQFRCGK